MFLWLLGLEWYVNNRKDLLTEIEEACWYTLTPERTTQEQKHPLDVAWRRLSPRKNLNTHVVEPFTRNNSNSSWIVFPRLLGFAGLCVNIFPNRVGGSHFFLNTSRHLTHASTTPRKRTIINHHPMAAVVQDGKMSAPTQGGLFQGMIFWLSLKVPQRPHIAELIKVSLLQISLTSSLTGKYCSRMGDP